MIDTSLPTLGASFAHRFPELSVDWRAVTFPDPELVVLDEELAGELGLDAEWLASEEGVKFLTGSAVPASAKPVAMVYAGHQFGSYSPRLGDGRALLLGELGPEGATDLSALRDLHLKGSGRTPLARGGDGFASLGPMLREYVLAHAMAGLGIATTRSLAVVRTGQSIVRTQGLEPGAVLARVAASHLRIGTFEYAVRLDADGLIDRLVDYCLARHYPETHLDVEVPALRLLRCVVDAQASLVARWMAVGFIHGVMNTDNITISGETIDYGPCAFVDDYRSSAVFSSIDHSGRYAFGQQPGIVQWDLARLAETLLGVLDPDLDRAIEMASGELERFTDRYRTLRSEATAAKLGLTSNPAAAVDLGDELLGLMEETGADFTLTFRDLAALLRGDEDACERLRAAGGWTQWRDRWRSALAETGAASEVTAADMDAANPLYVPRNHNVEAALASAVEGELDELHALVAAVSSPFVEREGDERFASPPPPGFSASYQTFCGT